MIAKNLIKGEEVQIRQATKQNWIGLPLCGGIADLSFPTSKLRRGRVQFNGQISPALTCGMNRLSIF